MPLQATWIELIETHRKRRERRVRQGKVACAKPDETSSLPGAPTVGEENWLPQSSSDICTRAMCMHTKKYINLEGIQVEVRLARHGNKWKSR